MGGSISSPSSNNQHSGSRFLSRHAASDKSCLENVMCRSDMVDNTMDNVLSNMTPKVTGFDDLEVAKLGIVLTSIRNICDSLECQASNVSSSDRDGNLDQNDIKAVGENRFVSSGFTCTYDHSEYQSGSDSSDDLDECSDQNETKSASLHTNVLGQFCGAEALQLLDDVQVSPSVQDATRQLSLTMHSESSTESTTVKLLSALKGSRAQCGMLVNKLSVKWAPDVYDPPITLESHTVKGQRRRSKSTKKEYSKHKNGKSKTTRSGGGEKKHSSRRSSHFDPKTARYGTAKGVNAYDASGLPVISVLDYKPPELKCGASLYMESLGRLQLPVAEAS